MRQNKRKAREILRSAAAVMRRLGLAKGYFFDQQGHVCARAALNVAAGMSHTAMDLSDPEFERAYSAVAAELWDRKLLLLPTNAISTWSDRLETTTEDVASVFELVAERV
jgi:hypothetical protein